MLETNEQALLAQIKEQALELKELIDRLATDFPHFGLLDDAMEAAEDVANIVDTINLRID